MLYNKLFAENYLVSWTGWCPLHSIFPLLNYLLSVSPHHFWDSWLLLRHSQNKICFSSCLRGTTKYMQFCNRHILVHILHGVEVLLSSYPHNMCEILQVPRTKMNHNSMGTWDEMQIACFGGGLVEVLWGYEIGDWIQQCFRAPTQSFNTPMI